MEVNKLWKGNDINKYHIISLDKETNEWKSFREIVGHTVFWKDEPSHYGMTKTKAIEVLNIIKNLENEETSTEAENPTKPENEGEGTEPSETTPTSPSDTHTEPSDAPTSTEGETSTGENTDPKTPLEGNTEPTTPVEEPTTPTEPTEEPQYKIITISSVTYNSEEVVVFDDADYRKLKTTLTYIVTTYPNTDIHVVTAESDTGKSIFYFYLDEELTWFLELRTNIDYSLVNHVTTLDDIKKLL